MKNNLLFGVLITSFGLMACQEQKPATALTATEVSLIGKDITKSEDLPENQVFLRLNGKEILLDTINNCQPIDTVDWQRYSIPPTAMAACGGWWAGAGDYFYALLEKDSVVIYQGWQAEEQEDEGYHWEKKQAFSIR